MHRFSYVHRTTSSLLSIKDASRLNFSCLFINNNLCLFGICVFVGFVDGEVIARNRVALVIDGSAAAGDDIAALAEREAGPFSTVGIGTIKGTEIGLDAAHRPGQLVELLTAAVGSDGVGVGRIGDDTDRAVVGRRRVAKVTRYGSESVAAGAEIGKSRRIGGAERFQGRQAGAGIEIQALFVQIVVLVAEVAGGHLVMQHWVNVIWMRRDPARIGTKAGNVGIDAAAERDRVRPREVDRTAQGDADEKARQPSSCSLVDQHGLYMACTL